MKQPRAQCDECGMVSHGGGIRTHQIASDHEGITYLEPISYNGAHVRIRREKGSARDHACVDCGQPAFDWSLKPGHEGRYSLNLDDYEPRCRPCHIRLDGWGGGWPSNSKRYVCDTCGYEGHAGVLGRHRKKTGHPTFTPAPNGQDTKDESARH